MADYKRLGYSDRWINQRIQSIGARKELTDEWEPTHERMQSQVAALTMLSEEEEDDSQTFSNDSRTAEPPTVNRKAAGK